nr:T-cell surface glycoprotein CD3 zeta chain isoform X2 [Microcebus murinus]
MLRARSARESPGPGCRRATAEGGASGAQKAPCPGGQDRRQDLVQLPSWRVPGLLGARARPRALRLCARARALARTVSSRRPGARLVDAPVQGGRRKDSCAQKRGCHAPGRCEGSALAGGAGADCCRGREQGCPSGRRGPCPPARGAVTLCSRVFQFGRSAAVPEHLQGQNQLYNELNLGRREEYDILDKRRGQDPEMGGKQRKRTPQEGLYNALQKDKMAEAYSEIRVKGENQRRRGKGHDVLYQGLSTATKDTYDALHMQALPPR